MVWIYEILIDFIRFILNFLVILFICFVLCIVGVLIRVLYFIDEFFDIYVENGKLVVLNCLIGGNIKFVIVWRRNGIFLDLV